MPFVWNASHMLPAGAKADHRRTQAGTYATWPRVAGALPLDYNWLGARASHLERRSGASPWPRGGRALPWGRQFARDGAATARDGRLTGRQRITRSWPHADRSLFTPERTPAFETTAFTVIRVPTAWLAHGFTDGYRFRADGADHPVPEVIVPRRYPDHRDGAPFGLMGECRTTGRLPSYRDRHSPRPATRGRKPAIWHRDPVRVHTLKMPSRSETPARSRIKAPWRQIPPA